MGLRGPKAVPQLDPNSVFTGASKRCTKCKREMPKLAENFGMHRQTKNGIIRYFINPACRKCESERAMRVTQERIANGWVPPPRPVEQNRRQNLKKRRLTPQEYDAMLAEQGGVCKICKHPSSRSQEKGIPRAMFVDHDHTTGKIRGLLCCHCNNGLGYFHDNPDRMMAAIRYLEEAHA